MSRSMVDLAARAVQLRRPGDGLTAVSALRSQLDTLEEVHVGNALRAGWSWSRIAGALGVSKQAAHRKHAKRVGAEFEKETGGATRPGKLIVTAEARRVVQRARGEARALGHAEVSRAHLLLGLLGDAYGPALRALASSGATLSDARSQLRQTASGPPCDPVERPPMSRDARETFEGALREAVRLRDGHLGVEHLLLALLGGEEASIVEILVAAGTTPADVERSLSVVLEQPTLVFEPGPSVRRAAAPTAVARR